MVRTLVVSRVPTLVLLALLAPTALEFLVLGRRAFFFPGVADGPLGGGLGLARDFTRSRGGCLDSCRGRCWCFHPGRERLARLLWCRLGASVENRRTDDGFLSSRGRHLNAFRLPDFGRRLWLRRLSDDFGAGRSLLPPALRPPARAPFAV